MKYTRRLLAGERFGRLLVVEDLPMQPTAAGRMEARVRAVCDCGEQVERRASYLTHRSTELTGCRLCSATAVATWTRKHGGHGSPTYQVWIGMRARCGIGAAPHKNYGGRGIKVCERWSASFENFLADMGERPPGLSIDRINNEGDYEPGNCRWATGKEQAANRRPRNRGPMLHTNSLAAVLMCAVAAVLAALS